MGARGKEEAGRIERFQAWLLQKAFGVPGTSPPLRCSAHFCQGLSRTGTKLFPKNPGPGKGRAWKTAPRIHSEHGGFSESTLQHPSSMSSSPEGWRRLSTAKSSGQVLAEYGAEN